MPKIDFTLPIGDVVTLIYGEKYPGAGTLYLQSIRTGIVNELSEVAKTYHAMEQSYASRLASAAATEIERVDVVVSPPSSRGDSLVYRNAINKDGSAKDLSAAFSRKHIRKAAEPGSVADMISEFDYARDGMEAKIKSLLIVDESIASGKSASAVLEHLRAAGLPADCRIIVAVWAFLKN